MRKEMRDLCWTAHRAEGEAAHDGNQTTGNFHDIRGEQDIPVTEEGIHIYNLGVANGVKCFLGQLSEEGYGITAPSGVEVVQQTEQGEVQNFDQAFSQWLTGADETKSPEELFARNRERNFRASSALEGMVHEEDPE